MRQIFLDTETTGFDYKDGHRIIEFGAVECVNRKLTGNNMHFYFCPDIEVEEGAFKVHGISNNFLQDKPLFVEKIKDIIDFIVNAELVIHNAAFDIPFLNHELSLLKNNTWGTIENHSTILDSLVLARKKHPGQRNSLDALCKRYGVNNTQRTLHGALLDAEILADVYLAMTGGQTNFVFFTDSASSSVSGDNEILTNSNLTDSNLLTISLKDDDSARHEDYLQLLTESSGKLSIWDIIERSE